MRELLKQTGVVLLLALLALPVLRPAWNPDFFTGHDIPFYAARITDLAYCIEEGRIYPRWLPHSFMGYGGPVLHMNPPLVYYVAVAIRSLGNFRQPTLESIRWLVSLGFVFGAYFTFLLVRRFYGEWGGLLAAAGYLYAPYHRVDVYVRGALPEFLAIVLLPLVLLCLDRLSERLSVSRLVLAAAAVAALILSHVIVAYLFLSLAFAFALLARGLETRRVVSLLASFLGALLLSAFYVVPAMADIPNLRLQFEGGYYDFHNHFLTPRQWFDSKWKFGHSPTGMPFQVGWAHWLAVPIAALTIWKTSGSTRRVTTLFLAALLFALFLTLPASQILWEHLPFMHLIVYPWRFMTVVSLSTALLLGGAGVLLSELPKARPVALLMFLAICVIVYRSGFVSQDSPFREADFSTTGQLSLFGPSFWEFSATDRPKDVERLPRRPSDQRLSPLRPARARGWRLDAARSGCGSLEAIIDLPSTATLRASTFYFPGWTAKVDGVPTDIRARPHTGEILLEVPSGRHLVELDFCEVGLRLAMDVVSITAAVLFGGLAVASFFLERRPRAREPDVA